MSNDMQRSTFYFKMGLLLLALIFAGFGSAAFITGRSPLDLPALFHMHGIAYILWYSLFILQTRLILNGQYITHKRLGYASLLVVSFMLVTGFLMASNSYARGTSPIPNMTVQQFLAFPLMDLVGIVLFYSIGLINRHTPNIHKHAMLIMCIAMMDPAVARLALAIGFPPLMFVLHIGLVVLVMIHDRKIENKIHFITWMGLAYVILRISFIMLIGPTEFWESLVNGLFG